MSPLSKAGQILAASVDVSTMIAVIGAANFRLAPPFRQAAQAAKLAGSHMIVVEMAQCTNLDSTFMGTLATLGFASQKPGGIPTVLINVQPFAHSLLHGLGITRLIKSYPPDSLPPAFANMDGLVNALKPVESAAHSQRDMAALMYDAHETLTRVDPENIQRFKDVLEFLRKDAEDSPPLSPS